VKGSTIVGRLLRLIFLPGGTQKSFELIVMFDLSVMAASLFPSAYFLVSLFLSSCSAFSKFWTV
jgi:hypothetical protein